MWNIGRLSRTTDCKIETIRYYEKIGLLPKPSRSDGGHRLYTAAQVSRLLFIRRARTLGFTLEHVRELIELSQDKQRSCQDALALTVRHLDLIETKLTQLQQIKSALMRMAGDCRVCCPDAKAPDCTIFEALTASYAVSTDNAGIAKCC